MKDERYAQNLRGLVPPFGGNTTGVVVGDHIVNWEDGSDPDESFEHGVTPNVTVTLLDTQGANTQVCVYRDFETGRVVVQVTGDPDRVLFNEATFHHETNYYNEAGQRADDYQETPHVEPLQAQDE